ncbi:uncharacterized protein LOC126742280 isoform X2 [Anthonomus grandis grandis]|uniref:uncharacterized protein LOC126742280 isoform X2 n=1 Tax=Anthonomus grandis grandis TaxID=2921223 RepID=UPI0021661255|nr:uncharacterized protein LOC126742280 isoform X2 [Anthonomus grandis grandis]
MVHLIVLVCAFLFSTLILILARILDQNPLPIFGIYQRRSGVYWFKCWFLYVFFIVRKLHVRLVMPNLKEYYKNLDKAQKLSPTPKAVDAVFFNAANKNGDYFTIGFARRPDRIVDGFIYLKLASTEYGLLESLRLPSTTLFNSGEEESFEAEGIKITTLEPMKKWRIYYKGNLRPHGNFSQHLDVTIDAIFHTDEPCYNFLIDLDPWSMAKNFAYETWSIAYFKNVSKLHQLHYQQFGTIDMNITINKKEFKCNLDAVRDHTIAKHRDWGIFRRYALHWITTENGDHFSLLSLCQSVAFSRLQLGFMWKASERKLYPIRNSSLELYQYGELGTPPKDYGLTFTAGSNMYDMKVTVLDSPFFYISKAWESKIFECHCAVEINGIKGHGGVEWQYKNLQGKNAPVD